MKCIKCNCETKTMTRNVPSCREHRGQAKKESKRILLTSRDYIRTEKGPLIRRNFNL